MITNRRIFRSVLIIAIVAIIGAMMYDSRNAPKLNYPVGKDTVDYFGDAKYQTSRWGDGKLLITNDAVSISIEDAIYGYDVCGDEIFIIGERGYTIINYKTDCIKQLMTKNVYIDNFEIYDREEHYGDKWVNIKSYSDFSVNERAIFDKIKTDIKNHNLSRKGRCKD